MLVESMTHEEVYQELARDREAVTRWWQYQLGEQRRRALKCSRFPLNLWFDYVSPRKVRYMFYTRILDRRMKNILTGINVVRLTREGITGYTTWTGYQQRISPMVMTPHMLRRYAERHGVSLTGSRLLRYYFSRNAFGTNCHNQKVVGKSVRYNGKEHLSVCVPDGVLLGQQEGDIYIARTFITYDMCSGLQQQEFEDARRHIKNDQDIYNSLRFSL